MTYESEYTEEQLHADQRRDWERRFPSVPYPDPETPAASDPAPAPSRKRSRSTSNDAEFSGPLAPIQLKLPADLIQSLRLAAIQQNETMSAVVLRCLTSSDSVARMWVSSRRSG